MRAYLVGFYRSFPVQLVLLHFRRYQVLLVFWFIIASSANGGFMNSFGADSLFLAPEYLGKVNFLSAFFVGAALGVFIMSWNITTFILHSDQFKFLATTTNPFLKYCINNAAIPVLFFAFYVFRMVRFDVVKELMTTVEVIYLTFGFLAGLVLFLFFSFLYFFGADRTILRTMATVLSDPQKYMAQYKHEGRTIHKTLLKVEWYFSTRFRLKQPRNVSHYSQNFLDSIFKRHHFAAVLSILLAFIFLTVLGFFMDNPLFQLPAGASILILFSLLIAASGALAYWLESWSIPAAIILFIVLNILFKYGIIDPRNRAYGLNYELKNKRPEYTRSAILDVCTEERISSDKEKMIRVLENWKARQDTEKPIMIILNFSGGGSRSACFAMNVLQHLDSAMNGQLMNRTFLMTGASGGMLGAAYFRELCRLKDNGESINLQDESYVNNISKDLLNPLFSSFVTRDLLSPAQKFKAGPYNFVKDRGYAFEEQLNLNTGKLLDKTLGDYQQDESMAKIPLAIFNSTISRDGRKMMISTQPISFLMRNPPDTISGIYGEPDAIDFSAYFKELDPMNLRLLTALRINATFPYVLPNVWLPTQPVIDVMDAGLRDNYGQETSLRFLHVFEKWIQENTSGVLYFSIRDRKRGEWEDDLAGPNVQQLATKPLLILQHNWYKIQDYIQDELVNYSKEAFPFTFDRISFLYLPSFNTKGAALNFHLTAREKRDIANAVHNPFNQASFKELWTYFSKKDGKPLPVGEMLKVE